jgi:hypothetical protein
VRQGPRPDLEPADDDTAGHRPALIDEAAMASTGVLALARAGVELSVRRLPDLDDRLRYRAEFRADLHALTRLGQLRYAAGVLSQTFALRAALGSSPSRAEEAAMSLTTQRSFSWRCQVFRVHRWVSRSTEDGARHLVCRRCGRDKGQASWGPGNTIGV